MPHHWLPKVLARIRALAAGRQVRFTYKALRELAGLGLDEDDACDILAELGQEDFFERIVSEHTAEWTYVFKPIVAGTILYLKIIIHNDCVVISLHEDEVSDERQYR